MQREKKQRNYLKYNNAEKIATPPNKGQTHDLPGVGCMFTMSPP